MIFDKNLTLADIKSEPYVIENIRWDIEPKDLMEPRITMTPEGVQTKDAIKGYVFYIDTMDKEPILFLMRHTAAGFAETLAQIDEIPRELLKEAVEENKGREYFSMYPLNKKAEAWLRKELGISA